MMNDYLDLTDPETGRLDRTLTGLEWRVPRRIELKGDRLVWAWFDADRGEDEREPRLVKPDPGLLEPFMKLAERSDPQILGYAKKWGVLGLCPHGLPGTHLWPPLGPMGHPEPKPGPSRPIQLNVCHPAEDWSDGKGGRYWEPVDGWRKLAREMRAVLNIAARLRRGKPGGEQEWKALCGRYPRERLGQASRWTMADERYQLAGHINYWATTGFVNPMLVWRGDQLRWEHRFAGVFGALAFEVMLAVCGDRGLATCSSCQRNYVPPKRPSPSRRSYCDRPACYKAARADASRDYRARKKVLELSRQRVSAEDSARRVKLDAAVVRAALDRRTAGRSSDARRK